MAANLSFGADDVLSCFCILLYLLSKRVRFQHAGCLLLVDICNFAASYGWRRFRANVFIAVRGWRLLGEPLYILLGFIHSFELVYTLPRNYCCVQVTYAEFSF